MKNFILACATRVLLFAVTGLAIAQQAPTPTAAGVYMKTADGYAQMERVTQSGFKTKGMAKVMFSYGIAKLDGVFIFKNPTAFLRITERKPTFLLVSPGEVSMQDIALVKMEQKKDHRESQFCKAGAWTGVKLENQSGVALDVARTPIGITITPREPLEPGEYLLVTMPGGGAMGYDFGVTVPLA